MRTNKLMTTHRNTVGIFLYPATLKHRCLYFTLFLLGFSFLLYLGTWQWSRFEEKKTLWQKRDSLAKEGIKPLSWVLEAEERQIPGRALALDINVTCEPSFIYLSNQVEAGRLGFRPLFFLHSSMTESIAIPVIGHFQTHTLSQDCHSILHNRLWLLKPQKHFHLQKQPYENRSTKPVIMEWMDLTGLATLSQQEMATFWLTVLEPSIKTGLSPEKHIHYALQWFLFAGLWLVYGIYFARKRRRGDANID